MKSKLFLLTLFTILFASMSFSQERTEEYAVIDVVQVNKKTYRIRITEGEKPAEEKEWKKEKSDEIGDFSPVIKELNILNGKGFEVVNMSSTNTGGDYAQPRFTFLLVRKLNED